MPRRALTFFAGLRDGRGLIRALNLALVVALALTSAYWSWALWLLATPPSARLDLVQPGITSPTAALGLNTPTRWFGGAEAPLAVAAQNLKLVGTYVGNGQRASYAMLIIQSGKAQTLAVGAEIAPGQRLSQVLSDHVLIDNATAGRVERLDLDRKPLPKGLLVTP